MKLRDVCVCWKWRGALEEREDRNEAGRIMSGGEE